MKRDPDFPPSWPYPEAYWFDFGWSGFALPEIDHTSIRVPVRSVGINDSFPGVAKRTFFKRAVLVFEDVAYSERRIAENMLPEDKKFYKVSDGPFDKVEKELFVIELSGPLDNPLGTPLGWIEWYIAAASARVEDASS